MMSRTVSLHSIQCIVFSDVCCYASFHVSVVHNACSASSAKVSASSSGNLGPAAVGCRREASLWEAAYGPAFFFWSQVRQLLTELEL